MIAVTSHFVDRILNPLDGLTFAFDGDDQLD